MIQRLSENINEKLDTLFGDSKDSFRFSKYLPYRLFDEESELFHNESSLGFCIEVTPLCGASEDIINTITGMITDGIPEGVSMQVLNWASPNTDHYFDIWARPRNSKGGVYGKLAKKRQDYFSKANSESLFDNPYLIRDFRIVICVSIPNSKTKKLDIILSSLRSQLVSTLKTAGMTAKSMGADSFLSFINELVNPTTRSKKHVKWNKKEYLHDHLSNFEQSVKIGADYLQFSDGVDEKDVRVFSVKEYPEMWSQWLNQDLIGDFYSDYQRMGCPFLLVFSFKYGSEISDSNKISFKLMRSIQKSNSGLARFDPSIPEVERDLKFVDGKLKGGQKLVKASFQVVTYSNKLKGEHDERQIKSLFKNKGWSIQKDKYLQLQSFIAALPFSFSEGMSDDLEKFARLKSMVTWTCANVAPLQGEWKGHLSPKILLFGRRGQPMFWDPFSNVNGNYNVSFIGKSGSGKSVAMQETVASLLATGGQVVVIDDGRSFMNSCILQNGNFIEFSTKGNICLNPFSMISESTFQKDPDYKEEVLHFINLLIRQMCKETETTSDVEKSLIEESVSFVWETKRTQGSVTNVAEYLLSKKDPRANDLGLMLSKFSKKGLYSRFFEGQATIKLDNPFYVFEFDRLKSKPDLLKVVVMVVMFLAKEKAFHGDRTKTTSLVIDEAHSLLGGAQGAEACEAFARKSRKHKAQLITGTQSIDDYYKNPAGNAIVQNTDWYCLLSQNAESVEAMKQSKRILIDPQMEKALKSLKMVDHQYSEMMVYGGGIGWFIGRLILDPFSIALYSSKGEDFKKIQDCQQGGMSLEDAIERVSDGIKINNEK